MSRRGLIIFFADRARHPAIKLDSDDDFSLCMKMPQFGEKLPGKTYILRPGGYAVVLDARCRILAISEGGKYFLTGGGIETGESASDALVREAAEETGMAIRIVREIGHAGEYVYSAATDAYYNKIGTFFLASIVESPDQHNVRPYPNVVWASIDEFTDEAAHQSHVWAIRRALTDSNHPPGPDRS
jgi:8-oxo-dGTP diphosphatase